MPNQFYTRVKQFLSRSKAKAADVRSELDAISAGFDKLPTPLDDGTGFSDPVKVGTATDPAHATPLSKLDSYYTKSEVAAQLTLGGTPGDVNVTDLNAQGGSNNQFLSIINGVIAWTGLTIATTEQAQAGTNNTALMTPAATEQAISHQVTPTTMVKIAQQTVTTPVASVMFTGLVPSDYQFYMLSIDQAKLAGNDVNLGIIVGDSAGNSQTSTHQNSANGLYIPNCATSLASTVNASSALLALKLMTTQKPVMHVINSCQYKDSGDVYATNNGLGDFVKAGLAATPDKITISNSDHDLTAGTFTLYGVK